MRRFYVPQIPGLGILEMDEDLKHRIGEVLRFSEGEELDLIDGRGCLAKATVIGRGKKIGFNIKEVEQKSKDSKKIIVAVSVIRRERFDVMVEKAVELGADEIIPFVCERSRPYSSDAYEKLKDRWQRIADQALSQCRRLFRCKINDIIELDKIDKKIIGNMQAFAFDPYKEQGAFVTSLIEADKDVFCLIGPEGGFTQKELDDLSSKGFRFHVLTDNILRTETAVMYVLSVIELSKK